MPDTPKTLDTLISTDFKDGQAPGSITPQTMRDLIESIARTPFGGYFTETSVETEIVTKDVYQKGACTTQSNNLRLMDTPVDNRLRFLGTIPYHIHIACTLSMVSAGNGKKASFKLFYYDDSAQSGSVIDGSRVNRTIGTGADEGSTALHWDLVMDANDYLELWVANLTDNTNITLTHLYLFAMSIPM
ncbi:MAG TPA: hypothetical protein ENI23_00675 [bacterium]|nr:hypothetical protein [bacterium]